jgi:hypothetical protein
MEANKNMAWKFNPAEIDTITPARGLDMASAQTGARPSPRMFHTGNQGAQLAADGNNSTPVTTELYVAELFVPATCFATGIAVFNGSDVTDNVKVALYDSAGNLLRASASTAGSGVDSYQLVPFATGPTGAAATTVVLPGPATYYVGTCYAGTTSRFNTFAVGSFGGGKITGLVFATNFASTALTITPPTTFTTALAPIASLY